MRREQGNLVSTVKNNGYTLIRTLRQLKESQEVNSTLGNTPWKCKPIRLVGIKRSFTHVSTHRSLNVSIESHVEWKQQKKIQVPKQTAKCRISPFSFVVYNPVK